MQEHTKKPHIDTVELHFIGPVNKQKEALELLKKLGFQDVSDSIPWRDAFPGIEEHNLPGISLAGARGKEGLTQVQLSELTGIPQRHISEMERGKRPIGKKTAKLFSKVLRVDYRIFL